MATRLMILSLSVALFSANAYMEKVAPLLCAGITTYSSIKYAGVKSGDKVGAAGFGRMGSMAVKYLKETM